MKIVHLSYSDSQGGAARAAYRIHQSLIKNGLQSKMWVNDAKTGDQTVKGPINKRQKLLNLLYPHLINNSLVKMHKTQNKIIHSPSVFSSAWVKYINESDADIVHLHWIQNEMISISDIPKIKKSIVWTLHDMWAFCGAEHLTHDNRWREGYKKNNRPIYDTGFDLNRWTWKRKLRKWKKPIQIVAPSKWLANCVLESKLMAQWPVSVISNPLDTDSFKPISKKIAREQLNLPQDVSLMLFGAISGSKSHNKGFDLLSNALNKIDESLLDKKLKLIIFGEQKKDVPPDIKFPIHYMGHLQDDISLRLLYSAADIMVVPSRIEAFGQTASEAQACATPVVSFDNSGLTDIVDHKKTGYLAKALDVNDLTNGITWVLNNHKLLNLGDKSREQAVKKFSEKIIAKHYFDIYDKVLKPL